MNRYCYHCKSKIEIWDKFKKTDEGYIHNNDDDDCYAILNRTCDEFGDSICDE